MALVLRVRLVLTKNLSLKVPQLLVYRMESSYLQEKAARKCFKIYELWLRSKVLEWASFPSWPTLPQVGNVCFYFPECTNHWKTVFFFFVKPDLNSHESINRTPFHPRYIHIHIHVMMHLSGHLIHPGGVGDAQHSLFWNTSSPPALLQTSWAYLLIVYAKLFIFGTAGVILFPRHYCMPHTVFTESIFRLHSSELLLIKV